MFDSAETLLNNVILLGMALLLLLALALGFRRAASRVLGYVLLHLDASGEVLARWSRRLSRMVVLFTILLSVLLMAGIAVLTAYELNAGTYAWEWALRVLDDPADLAWATAKLFGALLVGLALYLVLNGLARLVIDGVGHLVDRDRYSAHLELLAARLQTALRWTLGLGVVLFWASGSTVAEAVEYPLTVLTYAIVSWVMSRSLVAAARLAVDVLFDVSTASAAGEATSKRGKVFRYVGRLGRLATATRYALEYFIYVGTATVVVGQLDPDTSLATGGVMALRVIGILYLTRALVEVCDVALRELFALRDSDADEATRHQRATLVPVATSLVRYAAYILGVAIALDELGLDTTPLLAAASLVGVAVGLGAQAIVSDLVSGFFILFEGIFLVGHRVRVGEVEGSVEEIGVRMTKIRDSYGILHCIPNGEIRAVASFSHGYVNAIVEFGLPHEVDLPRVFSALRQHFAAVRTEHTDILGDTEIVIEELRESCIWVRAVTRVKPGKDDEIQEALRVEVVAALAAAKIDPPHERRLVAFADGTSRLDLAKS